MAASRQESKAPQNDPEYAKKMAEFERQMRTEQMLMLSLLSRFVKAAERIADVMEKTQAPNSPILGPNGTVAKADGQGPGHA